jgi:hypothetical protein
MTTPNTQAISPDQLVNQLFDAAIAQSQNDLRMAARTVIVFLTEALFYAVTSAKNDPIVFLTETLINAVTNTSGDEAARKEMLKLISDTIVNAPSPQKPSAPAPTKPAAGKP